MKLLTLVAFCTASAYAAPYYVATTGSDSGPCTLASPCLTLSHAQSLARASAGSVVVRGGIYKLTATLAFTSQDNNESWTAYPGETPVIDGNGGAYDLKFAGVNPLTMEGFTFQNMSAPSLNLDGGTYTFRWNKFLNCNTNCIYGPGVQKSVIDSNTINGQTSGQSAIQLFYGSSGNQITHNLIQNTQGAGIDIDDGSNDPALSNDVIDRNILVNTNQNWTDMGAIYLSERTHTGTGNQITNNVISGNGGASSSSIKCIYLDDETSNTLVNGNVCGLSGNTEAYAIQVHGGDHNTITNNILDVSTGAQIVFYQASTMGDFGMAANVFSHNVIYSSGKFPACLWNVGLYSDDALPSDTTNLYFSGNNSPIPNTEVVDKAPIYQNPLFSSVSGYVMPSSSPAYTSAGFTALPTDQGPVANPLAPATSPWMPAVGVWFHVVSKNSNKCLDVLGGPNATNQGVGLDQWDCWGGSNQTFQLNAVSGGYEVTVQSSLLQLDVAGQGTQDGAAIIQWPFWSAKNEIWNFTQTADGYYTIHPLSTGKCMDVSGVSQSNGAQVWQWTCYGGDNQKWTFVPVQ